MTLWIGHLSHALKWPKIPQFCHVMTLFIDYRPFMVGIEMTWNTIICHYNDIKLVWISWTQIPEALFMQYIIKSKVNYFTVNSIREGLKKWMEFSTRGAGSAKFPLRKT